MLRNERLPLPPPTSTSKFCPAGKALASWQSLSAVCSHALRSFQVSNIRCGVALESVQCLNNYRLFGAQGCSGRQNWCRSCRRGGETSSAPALLLPLEASAVPTAWCRRGKRVPPVGKHGCRQNSSFSGGAATRKATGKIVLACGGRRPAYDGHAQTLAGCMPRDRRPFAPTSASAILKILFGKASAISSSHRQTLSGIV